MDTSPTGDKAVPKRGRVDPRSLLRTVVAYGTLPPSMLGGVIIGALNRDRNEIAQFGIATWMNQLFAITGVKVSVVGEENLWSQRPAVFIYNHRNNFDPYVALKLVGRDWGAVGKKELAGPLSGLAQWVTPNVAYLDRSNHDRAIQSLKPVAALLQRGISITVAPEGTRSTTGELGPFKKGAFRMAIEAGVPVVPIVIRNADSVTDRGAKIIRKGTIDVAVLPPIKVTEWKPEELDRRIEGVRKLFASTLLNWPGDPRIRAVPTIRDSKSPGPRAVRSRRP